MQCRGAGAGCAHALETGAGHVPSGASVVSVPLVAIPAQPIALTVSSMAYGSDSNVACDIAAPMAGPSLSSR